MRSIRSLRALLALSGAAALAALVQPANAGMEEAVKAMQAGDTATAEKELQAIKGRKEVLKHVAAIVSR